MTGIGAERSSDSPGSSDERSWNGSCTNPDLWMNASAKKSCPDLEDPVRVSLPFEKSALAMRFLDHFAEDTTHGPSRDPSQSSGSTGSRKRAGGVIIAA